MKAVEVLQRYEAGHRDFRGESLRGQSFQDQVLAEADFSGTDLRGTTFTGANLRGAIFQNARAGLQQHQMRLLLASGLLVLGVGLAMVIGSSVLPGALILSVIKTARTAPENADGLTWIYVGLGAIAGFIAIAWLRGILTSFSLVLGTFFVISVVTLVVGGTDALGLAVGVLGPFVSAFVFAGVVAFAGAVIFALVGPGAMAMASAGAVAFVIAGIIAIIVGFASAFMLGISFASTGGFAFLVVLVGVGIYMYLGWRAMQGNPRDAWLRSMVVALNAMDGTSFRGADLTDAEFSGAQLNGADFRRATLTRTRWRDATGLDRARPGSSYLDDLTIQRLLVTGNGSHQTFVQQENLAGVNLAGANLENTSFAGSMLNDATLQGAVLTGADFTAANLTFANLQDADLSQTKLVQTQLDGAALTGSTLTGATIEDWGITPRTQCQGIRCAYVFMRSPTRHNADPCRKPSDRNREFAEGEFEALIASMVD